MKNTSTVRTKKKRSPAIRAALVSLLIMMTLVVTLAMFTSGDLVTNRFESGRLDIVLLEPNWEPSDAVNVVPGDTIPKDPQVQNVDETDAYVFLKVTVPCVDLKLDDSEGNKVTTNGVVPMYKFVVNGVSPTSNASETSFDQVCNSQWEMLTGVGGADSERHVYTYIYAYKGTGTTGTVAVLHPNETTPALFDSLKVNNFNEKSTVLETRKNYSVNVEAYAIQAKYLANGNDTTNIAQTVWGRINS